MPDKWDQYSQPVDKWDQYASINETPQQTPAEASMFTNLKQGAIGAAKSAARTLYNSGSVQGPQYLQGSGLNINTAPAPEAVQPTNTAQRIGGYAETAGELVAPFLGGGKAAVAATEALPSFQKAGKVFQDLQESIGHIPVDTSTVTPIAKEASEMLGHTAPKAIADYLKRVMPKGVEFPLGPNSQGANIPASLTYKEARDLYSAVSKLTVKEAQESSGAMAHKVREFASALDDSIRQAIPNMTDQQKYAAAMKEYADAGTLGRQIDVLKKYGLPLAAGAILAPKAWSLFKTAASLVGQ